MIWIVKNKTWEEIILSDFVCFNSPTNCTLKIPVMDYVYDYVYIHIYVNIYINIYKHLV